MKIAYRDNFQSRHIGTTPEQAKEMLAAINADSIETLIDQTIPQDIHHEHELEMEKGMSEFRVLSHMNNLLGKNKVFNSFIGQGYYDCITPPVILRNILENPGWYTAYTPYQAEIAQGRLEALVNFQTMVCDLTCMELANASLLDEATAAAEAMIMMYNLRKGEKKQSSKFICDQNVFSQVKDVLKTRARYLNIELVIDELSESHLDDPEVFGAYVQYPDSKGTISDLSGFCEAAHAKNILVAAGTDLKALLLLKSPGEMGVDVVVGSTQRFGVPMGFGGPHAAFFATREAYKRSVPGRIIGISKDRDGNLAYRMALQTREQHIKREKATSNICTSQVLLAVTAGMYAVFHGAEGLRNMASGIHDLTNDLNHKLRAVGVNQVNKTFFDTLRIEGCDQSVIKSKAEAEAFNFYYGSDGSIQISMDETKTAKHVESIVEIFKGASSVAPSENGVPPIPSSLARTPDYLSNEVFKTHRSEHEILRYMRSLESKDLSLVHSMISLGSCTMKLNAAAEMIPVTWETSGRIHPYAPKDQVQGFLEMIEKLNDFLCEITGFEAISQQPNSGAQGEFAGLLVIKEYLINKGEGNRDIVLIPASAHGTNPASAVMAGMKVVVVKCDESGNTDIEDLKAKIAENKGNVAALMVTYPSTHGVFEYSIREVCSLIHEEGGQVYMDGANMNAQVGLTSPAEIGADVCHLNLHKTFCIPHGGGGPGMGPIGVAKHLVPFLPDHFYTSDSEITRSVSAAPFGSASILPISYSYIKMMGGQGLKNATQIAILNANYMMAKLSDHYPILYKGENGRCAHEFIIDLRGFKQEAGVEAEDVAKRLMDYGFHAPTVSFPVPGTLMVEPTESESKPELDRFIEAMVSIRKEIEEITNGTADKENNVLKNAPHTVRTITSDDYDLPYSRQKAAYPLDWVRDSKFWPAVSRIDNAFGDRNLMCTCIPMSEYEAVTAEA